MLRLGIVDCDTSHVFQFSRRLNHIAIPEDQWVEGAKIVAAYPGTSRVTDPSRIAEYLVNIKEAGVEIVDRPEDLLGKIDAVLVESNEGGVHRQRVTPFLEAGLPAFVDKPLASNAADARAIVDLAAKKGVPLLSASSLRFTPDIKAVRADASVGAILGADAYSPASLHFANPGLLHYGVHGVEMLYALLGPGCREVSCMFQEGGEVVTGRWEDGRLGVMRGLRTGYRGYGFTVYGEKGIKAASVDTTSIYRDLLKVIVPVLSGEQPSPVSPEELIEVVAFQEAALASQNAGGQPIKLG